MTDSHWWNYVEKLIGDDTAQDAARRAGFDKSAFTRWKKGARADPDFVVKLARAYGANVIEALAASGLITDDEAALRDRVVSRQELLRSLESEELASEQLRRLRVERGFPEREDEGDPQADAIDDATEWFSLFGDTMKRGRGINERIESLGIDSAGEGTEQFPSGRHGISGFKEFLARLPAYGIMSVTHDGFRALRVLNDLSIMKSGKPKADPAGANKNVELPPE